MNMQLVYLSQLAVGYWKAMVLFALAELQVFDHLKSGSASAGALSRAIGADEAACSALLDAGVALKLLRKTGADYENSPAAAEHLVSDATASIANWVAVMGRWVGPWSELARAVRTGRAEEDRRLRLGQDPAYTRLVSLGMHEFNRHYPVDLLSRLLGLGGNEHLLDVGGGLGTFSIALCRRHPCLTATLLDVAPVLERAREALEQEGLADRIALRNVDYGRDEYGRDADVVLLSNVLHQEDEAACAGMLARAYRALKAGGRVAAQGYFVAENRVSPVFATLHNLSTRLLWEGGHNYSLGDVSTMLDHAGFVQIELGQLANQPLAVVVGRVPQPEPP